MNHKTAITVLQELTTSVNKQSPAFDMVAQGGAPHCPSFEYECRALGASARAVARNKKDAKQDAAHLVLVELARSGMAVPPPYREPKNPASPDLNTVSYVALLSELCIECQLPAPSTRTVSDTGPPHNRHFEIAVSVGAYERVGAGSTMRAARQTAARALYTYLRASLSRIADDFQEEAALARAAARAAERFKAVRSDEDAWRPDMSMRVADYHTALTAGLDEEAKSCAREKLRDASEESVREALRALSMESTWDELMVVRGKLQVLDVAQSTAPFTVAGLGDCDDAAQAKALKLAHHYLTALLN